jgi:hypothetical protein
MLFDDHFYPVLRGHLLSHYPPFCRGVHRNVFYDIDYPSVLEVSRRNYVVIEEELMNRSVQEEPIPRYHLFDID